MSAVTIKLKLKPDIDVRRIKELVDELVIMGDIIESIIVEQKTITLKLKSDIDVRRIKDLVDELIIIGDIIETINSDDINIINLDFIVED